MNRLAGFLARRRWLVVGAWLALLVAALPLASRQTEDLTGGGFSVPDSPSERVETALADDYEGARDGAMLVVLEPASGVGQDAAADGVERMADAVAEVPDLRLPRDAEAQAEAALTAGEVAVVPLATDLPTDRQTDAASDLREAIQPGAEVDGVTAYLAGQPASWPGSRSCRRRTSSGPR